MAYLLGIDVGTSSAKVMIIDEAGEKIAGGSSEYDIDIPQTGYAEQSCALLWEAVCSALKQALQRKAIREEIAAVGVTGQMHGMVMLDGDKNPVRPTIIWADQRSVRQVDFLQTLHLEEHVGNPMATGFLLPSLLWVKENEPENFARMRYVMLPKDYIRYRLCGSIGTDYSDASGTLLFHLEQADWDRQTLEKLDIPLSVLPPCHSSCSIAGEVSAVSGRETGLKPGIPVIWGGGDTPMQLTGNGVIRAGQLCTNIGTASQINCICRDVPAPGQGINVFHHVPEALWMAVGAGLNGGIVLKWMRSVFFPEIKNYQGMDVLAEQSVPGANGLVMLPFLCGERSPYLDPNAKGILFGMTLAHTRKDVIRAGMESVVFSFRGCMEVFHRMGLFMGESIIASGGGVKSPLWLQMQADILGKTIYITEGREACGKGAAIAAGVGCGVYRDIEEACERTVRISDKVYEPDPRCREVYEERFGLYTSLYRNNRELF